MQEIINEIYEEVKRRCSLPSNFYGVGAWDHHIEIVYQIAKNNAKLYGANQDIVSLAALLHDIASVTNKDYTEEHHLIGAEIAEELLQKYNLTQEQISLIKKCILNHRGSRLMQKNSNEEICLADADAMAHFYSIPSLLEMVYVEKKLSIDDGAEFVLNKLKRSYNKLSPQGKKIVSSRYKAALLVLKKPDINEF
ncbi:MAG TPA: HD domain-containing protein [Candidatus Coprovivens excrementavium]|nr:HD domain-containing protein [Candidatus Coprovivens excrementavium]